MLELHIYGPAFGLASIDTQCLAAVYLMQSRHKVDDWRLIACNDPSISPFNQLPALKVDNTWIAGFRNIRDYLNSHDGKDSPGDADGETSEALLTFMENRGLPLIDLSLYVSSDNYSTVTRPALSPLLSWPESWTIPSNLRNSARQRSEHLGLGGLDVDAIREKELKKENEGITAAIPKSLRITKKSVTGLIGSTAEQTRFRMEAVTRAFLEPLEEDLGDKSHFVGGGDGAVDCFALALFSQMLIDDLPQPWLRNALKKHRKLHEWTIRTSNIVTGRPLPWASSTRTWSDLGIKIIDTVANVVPITLFHPAHTDLSPTQADLHTDTSSQLLKQKHQHHSDQRRQQLILRGIVGLSISSATVVGLFVYAGSFTILRAPRSATSSYHKFGEAGSLLGIR